MTMTKSDKIKGIVYIVLLAATLAFLYVIVAIRVIQERKWEKSIPIYYHMEEYTSTDEHGYETITYSGLYQVEDNGIIICTLAESMYPHADIPSEINGVKVTALGKADDNYYYGFTQDDTSLVSVNIPKTVTTLGSHFFVYSRKLTSVTGGEGLTVIGNNAFMGCSVLEEITLYSDLTTIGDWAFNGCFKLEKITIPDSVESIGKNAFFACKITITAPHEPEYYGYTPDVGVVWIVE